MKVAVINTFNAKDISYWSGIPFHTSSLLDSIFGEDICYITLPPLKRNLTSVLRGFYYNRIIRKKYYTWADERFIYQNRSWVNRSLKEDYDLIITYDFYLVPLLKKKHNKVIHWNDANFKNIHNYYDGYSNFCGYSVKAAHAIQRKALELSDAVIYSSDWAIETAVSYYNTDRKKLQKILFASNFKTSLKKNEIENVIISRNDDAVKLLFLGADWERKGGAYAVEVVSDLNRRGIKAFLYLVGTQAPPAYKENKYIVSFGFINKNAADGEEKLVNLFKECTFLMLPSLIDITPVAFSEANAFALPVITTNTGGIPSVIKNNMNGCCFKPEEFVEKAVEFILNHLPATNAYKQLCYSSFYYYHDKMSWQVVRKKILVIMQNLSLSTASVDKIINAEA